MTLERAQEIVSAINDRCLFAMGLVEPAKVGSLKDVSLADMLAAKAEVEAENARVAAHAREHGGSYSIRTIPADRLIAAAYALEHFRPDNEAVAVIPTTEWPYNRRALGVVGLEPGHEAQEDDGQ
jgi:hypothetical protein